VARSLRQSDLSRTPFRQMPGPGHSEHGEFILDSLEEKDPNCDERSDESPTYPFAFREERTSPFLSVGVEYQRQYKQAGNPWPLVLVDLTLAGLNEQNPKRTNDKQDKKSDLIAVAGQGCHEAEHLY
jgi:hypothetical protein